jgi:pimeloyl-ACP methyl ester carboxylesterase
VSILRSRVPGLVVTEREHTVPLDHARPEGPSISVFTRELADPEGQERPFLLFFEGGPGMEAPRPSRTHASPPWLERALADFRVLMMDQRGTGRSTPIGSDLPGTAQEQADRLANFRADSIVADAELIRHELEVERWSVLGQSFGGFCALAYLSRAPEALREVLFTGGLPALGPVIDEVYRTTLEGMRRRSLSFYERYPADRRRMLNLLRRAGAGEIRLPGGDALHPARVRQFGEVLGMSDGPERLHHLLELDPSSPAFLHDAEQMSGFARNPIYAILHEACWADGGSTRWSAERMLAEREDWPPEAFAGEHIFPWMFSDHRALAPLAEAAKLLAEREWPALYDLDRLRGNEVPAAAIIYAEDAYVPRDFSERTAAEVRGLRHWLTNEYEHDGLRRDGERVLGRLLDLARGRI